MIDLNDNALKQALTGRIAERTRGRLRDLEVTASHGSVVIRGQASTFHVKQLALAACNQVLEPLHSIELVLEIRVDPCHR